MAALSAPTIREGAVRQGGSSVPQSTHTTRMAQSLGDLQTVYCAGLSALVHVLKTADNPTKSISDCQSVVNQLSAVIHQQAEIDEKRYHADLWKEAAQAIQQKEHGVFDIASSISPRLNKLSKRGASRKTAPSETMRLILWQTPAW